ncbi:paraslipin [[Phormidium ambiguum] IAM M-71]|uniref:Paraslipin n=1 Tax=[Phormidium ambiguum] IAM M-71 TaxID=454136 RepID=A0A1U7I909_9CYAN|nr:paraslipin [Phormidium ambiguum]OKH32961.1 paraslipin [Phormidium ambiguum IAM M-71]
MEPLVLFTLLTLTSATTLASSVKIVRQGDEAVVEMLGKYEGKKLDPGLTFLIPYIENVAYKQTTREQILEMRPIDCITQDKIYTTLNFVVFWRMTDIERAYYKVQDLKAAMMNILITNIRSQIATMELDQIFTARAEINEALVEQLDIATEPWGVKITRVEMLDFTIGNKLVHEALKTATKNGSLTKNSVLTHQG